MKIKILLFCLSFLISSKVIKAQSSADTLQVIIGDKSNPTALAVSIKQTISHMPGALYMGFCSNHSLYLVKAEVKTYSTKNDFFDALLAATNSSNLLLKVGDFKDIIDACTFDGVDETKQIKNSIESK